MVDFINKSVEEVREAYGNEHDECGDCKHFKVTEDPIGVCKVPLPGLVNKIWVICKTSKMRCRLYEKSETTTI